MSIFGGGGAPAAPPMPPPPKSTESAAENAANAEQLRLMRAMGRQSTILAGDLTGNSGGKKSLLGA